MHRAYSVANGSLAGAAVFFNAFHGLGNVALVVQCVKHANNINAVFNAHFNKIVYYIIGIMLVAQKVLAAQQHLQLGVRQSLAQLAQALPRVLAQKAHTAIKGGAAPAF